jgi:hypothetical protein
LAGWSSIPRRLRQWTMWMTVVYPNIATPYTIGPASGNFPD